MLCKVFVNGNYLQLLNKYKTVFWYYNIHTYIHNWSLQLFTQDYDLASHNNNIVYVNFIHDWRGI